MSREKAQANVALQVTTLHALHRALQHWETPPADRQICVFKSYVSHGVPHTKTAQTSDRARIFRVTRMAAVARLILLSVEVLGTSGARVTTDFRVAAGDRSVAQLWIRSC